MYADTMNHASTHCFARLRGPTVETERVTDTAARTRGMRSLASPVGGTPWADTGGGGGGGAALLPAPDADAGLYGFGFSIRPLFTDAVAQALLWSLLAGETGSAPLLQWAPSGMQTDAAIVAYLNAYCEKHTCAVAHVCTRG
jgi:hypothetical protein